MDQVVLSNEQLIHMLKTVRSMAWIGFADNRTFEEQKNVLREILIVTRDIGNEPPA